MMRSLLTVLLLGILSIFVSRSALAETDTPAAEPSQIGEAKQFGDIKVTLEKVAFDGPKGTVELRMDNLSDEQKSIAFMLFVDAQSETGETGDYDYFKTRCDGDIAPKGTFPCTLSLIFTAPPKRITLRVGEGMAGDVVTFTLVP
jgi:hypothetical protein